MASSRSGARGGKKLSPQATIGQQGINLIERVVLAMGSAWHPSNASLDVGIDGEIELVDPTTHDALNLIIRVQGKATTALFPRETSNGFEWPVDERDLNYWLSGNAPVVFVVARPKDNEAYWVDVKQHFADPARKKALRIAFDKRRMRFDESAREALYQLAVPRDAGIYGAPRPRVETVYSNLLRISGYPERLWIGETELRRPADVYARLREAGVNAPEFVLRDRRLLAPYDLTQRPWSGFVDRGTVDEIDGAHWAQSEDRDLVNRFVELLGFCLDTRCRQLQCERRRDGSTTTFYFSATNDLRPRVVPYRSIKDATRRVVFAPYLYTKGPNRGEVSYYRHSAFVPEFRRVDGAWHLVITPTYVFTSDGRRPHPFYESKLKGIKALEKNATVLGQVVMWASLLRGRDEDEDDFFFKPPYPHLRFDQLATFTLPVGIDDDAWLPNEEKEVAQSVSETADDLPLFLATNPYADEPHDGEPSAAMPNMSLEPEGGRA